MIKTNIKMRVTPEQSAKVQEICFKNGINWGFSDDTIIYEDEPYIFIEKENCLRWLGENQNDSFIKAKEEEIDPELFIRTNGSCSEWKQIPNPDLATDKDNNKAKNPNSKHYELWEDFEAIDVIKLVLTDDEYKGFLKGNILKYRLRVGKKDDVSKEIEKIKDYERELNK